MSRRLRSCRSCTGKTRHANRRCSRCRRGPRILMGKTRLFRVLPADVNAPTVAELDAGVDITGYLT